MIGRPNLLKRSRRIVERQSFIKRVAAIIGMQIGNEVKHVPQMIYRFHCLRSLGFECRTILRVGLFGPSTDSFE